MYTRDGVLVAKRIKNHHDEKWYNAAGELHRTGDKPAVIDRMGGMLFCEMWYKGGKLHRENEEPAIIYYMCGKITSMSWFYEGKHREGSQPARIDYDGDKIKLKEWYENDKLVARYTFYGFEERTCNGEGQYHSINDQPAATIYDRDKISQQFWYTNGKLDRKGDKPAHISYFTNGQIRRMFWYKNGLRHRGKDLPAIVAYNEAGKIVEKIWITKGLFHRDYRPAEIYYYGNKAPHETWYQDNKKIEKPHDIPSLQIAKLESSFKMFNEYLAKK